MCQEAGISRNTMSEMKAGRVKAPTIEKLSKVAEYFSVSVDELTKGNIKSSDFSNIQPIDAKNPTQPDVPEGWDDLDDMDRKMVTDFINRLLQADKYRRGEKEGGC